MKRAELALAVALVLGMAACRNDAWDVQRMIRQPRYGTYRAGPFVNGQVLQAPPAGVVARPSGDSAEEKLARAVALGLGAAPGTPAILLTGERRFRDFCAVCHGAGGYGGSLVAANMHGLRPPSLRSRTSVASNPEAIYQKVTLGGARMPSLAEALRPAERWAVAAYIQRLRASPAAADSAARTDSLRAAALARRDTTGTRP